MSALRSPQPNNSSSRSPRSAARPVLPKRELRKLCRGKAAKHALFSDRRNERDRCSCPSEDIGDIISASANGKTLAVRMQVFLCSRQMIDTDNDVYAG